MNEIRRGSRFFEQITAEQNVPKPTSKKGRDAQLLKIRNTCIAYRYYYYSKIKRLKYEDVITLLSAEFFYSQRTIINLMASEESQVRQIFKEKKEVKELQKMFSFLSWDKQ